MAARQRDDGLQLKVEVEALPTPVDSYNETVLHSRDQNPVWRFDSPVPTGMPLGVSSAWMSRADSFRGKAVGRYERAYALLVCFPVLLRNESSGLAESHKRFVERVLRYTLARAAGIRLGDLASMTINGRSCSVMTEKHSGRRFVCLDDWALARGWASRWNPDSATTALTQGDRTILAPLGSRKLKIGANWIETGDVIGQAGGATFVRLSALEPGG